jgi:hypothetical protein
MRVYKISKQAMGAIMMALQNSILNETDIVPVLEGLEWIVDDKEELVVLNPPKVEFETKDEE